MGKKILRYFDIVYFTKLIALFIALYCFNQFYIGITAPGGRVYSAFLEQHLNYISWLSNSILYTSNLIAHLFGLHAYVGEQFSLKTVEGTTVFLRYSCLGLGVMSFWIAFVCTYNSSLNKKIWWGITGLAAIWIINCFRIGLLLVAMQKEWPQYDNIDHHTLFNYTAYALILSMIYFFTKEQKQHLPVPAIC